MTNLTSETRNQSQVKKKKKRFCVKERLPIFLWRQLCDHLLRGCLWFVCKRLRSSQLLQKLSMPRMLCFSSRQWWYCMHCWKTWPDTALQSNRQRTGCILVWIKQCQRSVSGLSTFFVVFYFFFIYYYCLMFSQKVQGKAISSLSNIGSCWRVSSYSWLHR